MNKNLKSLLILLPLGIIGFILNYYMLNNIEKVLYDFSDTNRIIFNISRFIGLFFLVITTFHPIVWLFGGFKSIK